MPKETFFNLAEEKQKSIKEAAIDEFAQYSYENASINRIVERCKIAKGSFYQYFEDKTDLFLYILTLISEEKIKYITPVMLNPEKHDFFKLIRELYVSGMKFAISNKKLASIGNHIIRNYDSAIYKTILDDNLPKANTIYEKMLNLAIARGEIREDIDVKFLSFIMTQMGVATFEYWIGQEENEGYDLEGYTQNVLITIDKYLDLIKNGIGK